MNESHTVFKKHKRLFIGVSVFLTSWVFYAASNLPYPHDIIGRALFRDDFVVDKCAVQDRRALGLYGKSVTTKEYCDQYLWAKSKLR